MIFTNNTINDKILSTLFINIIIVQYIIGISTNKKGKI